MKTELKTEILDELKELKTLKVGSEEYKVGVDGVTKLMDRAIELEKLDVETVNRDIDRENELYYKDQELKSNKKDRFVKDIINVASIVIPTTLAVWGTFVTLKFEETGTVTTTAGRNFISKLFPKK